MNLIKFEQEKCAHCIMVGNYLDSAGVQYEKVNAQQNPKRASQFGIMSVPVVILLDDEDNEIERSIGYKPAELQSMVEKL